MGWPPAVGAEAVGADGDAGGARLGAGVGAATNLLQGMALGLYEKAGSWGEGRGGHGEG